MATSPFKKMICWVLLSSLALTIAACTTYAPPPVQTTQYPAYGYAPVYENPELWDPEFWQRWEDSSGGG